MDYIYLGKSDWVIQLINRLDLFPDVDSYVMPEILALFIVIAKQIPDNETDFPFGKWASIQNLESVLSDHVKKELNSQQNLPVSPD